MMQGEHRLGRGECSSVLGGRSCSTTVRSQLGVMLLHQNRSARRAGQVHLCRQPGRSSEGPILTGLGALPALRHGQLRFRVICAPLRRYRLGNGGDFT